MKRLLDCRASDFAKMNGQQLKQAIQASEGRVILAEVFATGVPVYPQVSQAELAAAFGADLILLNLFDVYHPQVAGLSVDDQSKVVHTLKQWIGRPVGVNLEPVDPAAQAQETLDELPPGRLASTDTLARVKALGFDFVCLTGNPKTGVTNRAITSAIQKARQTLGEESLIIAGKMHGAGVAGESGRAIVSDEDIQAFVAAGADVILLPAPGTVPGITVEETLKRVALIRRMGALSLLAIGTSQEGADPDTIRRIALNNKMAGADIHHIGDAGLTGIALPENIMAYSIAIRGRRHTYIRMAASVWR
ncbi:hypothetical protein CathTA2_0531 [Caldalkalibacillus thermarum TA2.A1]|uniref:Haloacid dehalogenase-like hydrolase n=1 Tax=Caldalkalibacillus thermarum (strain TA2.A1) TaxID=986075 RepID=F5L419_CALTT|nr:hypothetical protein [Caldalkalibacillus thermarum]EGL83919.1 hypothetical protein CathTA2_0531 [Caldalkalibacillus thermarum TA2.A1]QZT34221.1 haloacid dehalogenase-like hydrolase [Caldalkalibacillus thermarum TA2.A1]